jgi:hypothetical protein
MRHTDMAGKNGRNGHQQSLGLELAPAPLGKADLKPAEDLSLDCYQDFKWTVVAGWGETWVITREEILKWIASRRMTSEYVKCAWCGEPVKLRDVNTHIS